MIEQINKQLEKHNNALLYNEDLYKYYKKHENNLKAIYISTPKKRKTAFEAMLKKADRKAIVKNKTILHNKITIKDENLNEEKS